MSVTIQNFRFGHYELVNGRRQFKTGPSKYGKCGVWGKLTNNSKKTIKYVMLNFQAYNRSNDLLMCISSKAQKFAVRSEDVIAPGKTWAFEEEALLYNFAVDHFVVEAMIQYEDDTVEGQQNVPIKKSGCYVATAVYGSYDCPEVWTLRRYRDNVLASTWYGRGFIRCYYAVGPLLVKWFGNCGWFQKLWRGRLDKMVSRLRAEGVEATPYEDKTW